MEFARESIIVSAVRTFCKAFAGIIGLLVGILLIFFGLAMFSTPDIYPPTSSLTIAPDAEGNQTLLPHTAPVILRLNINGVIGQGELTYEKMQNSLLDSRTGMLANDRVKAILLYINTPGGVVDDADGIYRALMNYKKKYQVPIYAFVDGLCASGGMYIASTADQVFATPTSIIGSVGVILGPTFNFSGLMERYGVQSLTITQGKDKDMLNPFRPWQPGEDASLQDVTVALYQRFVNIVTAARPRLDRDKLINDYGAQIYVSEEAQTLGYIDVADSDYATAVTALVKQANISDTQAYQVFTIAPTHSFLSELVNTVAPVLIPHADRKINLISRCLSEELPAYMNSNLRGKFLYLYEPGLEFSQVK